MTEEFKKLTGKNKNDYTQVANHLINSADVCLFAELVEKDAFLFDFVRQNVVQRLINEVNESNYKNLLAFLKYYAPTYEDFIISELVKYADEDLTDHMLNLLENGNDNEKTYAAKYFSYIQDPLAVDALKKNAYSDNEFLAANCASTLAAMGDKESFNLAVQKLSNGDDFEKLAAVKFLIAYGDQSAITVIIDEMKQSSLAENIAGEIPYLISLFDLIERDYENALLVINHIINGLGEILGLSVVFDFELFELFEKLITNHNDSKSAIVILNAIEKFDILTENDEYLFDEDKDTKNEVMDIKKLLKSVNKKELEKHINEELNESSPFVYTALEFATDIAAIRELLKSNNQTVILKTIEVLKNLGNLDESTKTVALLKVSDNNIKSIIRAL